MTENELLEYLTTRKKYGDLKRMLGSSNPALLSKIQESWRFDHDPSSFTEILYQYFNPTDIICSHGSEMKFQSYKAGYTCKRSCPCTREKYKKTMMERHGVESPMQSAEIKNKAEQTLLERYGSSRLHDVNKDKRIKTCIERYGANTPLQSEKIRKKIENTCLSNFGHKYPFYSHEVQAKSQQTIKNRYGVPTVLALRDNKQKAKDALYKKYGEGGNFATQESKDKIAKTHSERYGCHPSQLHIDKEKLNEYHNDAAFIVKYTNATSVLDLMKYYGMSRSSIHHRANDLGLPPKQSPDSAEERELYDFIAQYSTGVYRSDRTIIHPYELDIVIPSKQLAIEYDGIYFHSDIYPNYHLNKTNLAFNKGYQLIHIFSDEWLFKRKIVESRLKSLLGVSDTRIYARNTIISNIDTQTERAFLEQNHIQGYSSSAIKYGLYHESELVAIMTFGNPRFSKSAEYELIRYCSKLNCNVVGGAGKLFTHFVKQVDPKSVISYADKRWSVGKLYELLGFVNTHDSAPNYFYVKGGVRYSRHKFQKHKLIHQLDDFNPNESEYVNMQNNGYRRIYDCGNKVYVWYKK